MAPEPDMPLMMTEEAADDEVELDSPCCTTVRLARRFRKVLDDEGVVVFIRPGSSAKKKSETSVLVCFNHIWLGVELELVSKELNHLAAILRVYAGGLIFMK